MPDAANVVVAGDTVIVRPGVYAGAKFSRSGLSTAPITFMGRTGTILNRPGPLNTNNDNRWIRNAHYITLIGFESTAAPRSGIAVQGAPDAPATGVVLRDNFCHDNGRWGIFTGYAQKVRIMGNETSFSGLEHGSMFQAVRTSRLFAAIERTITTPAASKSTPILLSPETASSPARPLKPT